MSLPTKCQQCGNLAFSGGVVTIPAEEYTDLLFLKNSSVRPALRVSQMRLKSRSKIVRDPEVASFIIECAATMLIREIEAACLSKFGRSRAPSRSAIHRFLHTVAPRS